METYIQARCLQFAPMNFGQLVLLHKLTFILQTFMLLNPQQHKLIIVTYFFIILYYSVRAEPKTFSPLTA